MADSAPALEQGFARIVVRGAKERLHEFDLATRDAFNQIMDELAENPDQYPQRARPISRDGRTLLYTHPRPPFEVTYEVDRDKQLIYFLHFAAPKLDTGKPVFVSYSHQDQDWLQRIRPFLSPLEQKGLVRIWTDTDITPGQDWRKEIERALGEAKAALLLVTQNFLASDFIQSRELPQLLDAARDKGVIILWIAVAESLYEEYPIKQYQAVNDPKRPLVRLQPAELDSALKDMYGKIKTALEHV